jgi:hypothetical protein
MSKMIKQAYPVTITVAKGRNVPPGTAISLPADEADRLAGVFGTIPATEDAASSAPVARSSKPSLKSLEAAVVAKTAALEKATSMVEAENSAANLEALDRAQDELTAAEKALEEAKG